MELAPGQWEYQGLVFGRGCPIEVATVDIPGGEITPGDTTPPGTEDGRSFGLDKAGGRTITVEFFTTADTAEAARTAWAQFSARWRDPALRHTQRAVAPLRFRLPGGRERVVFGRPRNLDATSTGLLAEGRVEWSATFETADEAFYGAEHTARLGLVPDLSGGLRLPARLPASLAPVTGTDQTRLSNRGDAPAWPVITFHGPVAHPEVTWLATRTSLRLAEELAYDQSATIDTRPWARTALRSDGASLAGALTGPRLADLALPPGGTEVSFRGQDPTGRAACTIAARDAHTTP